MSSVPESIKLYYVGYHFWRGDAIRAALYLKDIPFENITMSMTELKALNKSPFGSFPMLEVDGKFLTQTQAMASYVGKLSGMYPSNDDPFAQANCDQILNGCTDITETIVPTMKAAFPGNKKEAREKLIDPKDGRLYTQLNGLNTVTCKDGSEFACGKDHGLTVADFAIWRLYPWFSGGSIDHIPADWIGSNFPNLKKIYDNVESNEKIQAFEKEYYPNRKK